MTLARDPQTGVYEISLSMKWLVVSKGDGRCRSVKFRWTLNRRESLKIAGQYASHEWTRRLNRRRRMRRMRSMRRMERRLRRITKKTRGIRDEGDEDDEEDEDEDQELGWPGLTWAALGWLGWLNLAAKTRESFTLLPKTIQTLDLRRAPELSLRARRSVRSSGIDF